MVLCFDIGGTSIKYGAAHDPGGEIVFSSRWETPTDAKTLGGAGVERKLLDLGVEVHRQLNMTNRNLRYNERNLRAGISDYVRYDMGPTSSMTIAAALRYAQEGFDGVVHLKSAGCTPEVDCIPVLQQVSRDTGLPILYLSYDSQTSDTGLDTRLEAFYDMLAMKKEKTI